MGYTSPSFLPENFKLEPMNELVEVYTAPTMVLFLCNMFMCIILEKGSIAFIIKGINVPQELKIYYSK